MMWDTIVADARNELPAFNKYLLKDFHRTKLEKIPEYIEDMFHELTRMLTVYMGGNTEGKISGKLEYLRKVVLSPEEQLQHMIDSKIIKGRFDINEMSFKIVRFDFKYDGEGHTATHSAYVYVPYMTSRNSIMIQGTEHFILFPIVEKGGVNIRPNEIIIKVMKAPLTTWRRDVITMTTTDGKVVREDLITVKIHQGIKGGKRTEKTPLVLYHLVKFGWHKTLDLYQITPDDISIVSNGEKDPNHSKIAIGANLFVRVSDQILFDQALNFKRRFLASAVAIFQMRADFTLGDVLDPRASYFWVVLGMYTSTKKGHPEMLYMNTKKHLRMNETLLDKPTQFHLRQVGINVNNLEDMMLWLFYNIDRSLKSYDSTDLYNKKVGSLEQIMASFVRHFFRKLFNLINNDKEGLTHASLATFMKQVSTTPNWFKTSMTRANPTFYNGNLLLQILAKKRRSLDNTESGEFALEGSGNRVLPRAALISHPSHPVVESILDITSSAPVIGGSMNPYCMIDAEGNIIKPEWAAQYDTIYR